VDSVGCPSGNVVVRFVRAPESIVLRRLAPAIQEWFAFQTKLGRMAGVEALCELLRSELLSALSSP
jgi:hypothetical protein